MARSGRGNPSSRLDRSELVSTIRELEAGFDWDAEYRSLEPSDSWESRTSVFYGFEAADRPGRVVLKVGDGWSPVRAREVYEDLSRLHDLFASRPDLAINVPRVLGWSESPAAICQVRIDGEELGRAIGYRARYRSDDIEDAIHRLGAALGVFHTAEQVDPPRLTQGAREEVRRGLLKMSRRLRIPPDIALHGVTVASPISRKYGDFYPHNLRLAPGGDIWVLDQPSSYTLLPIHRDVAYFLDRLSTHVGRHEPAPHDDVAMAVAHLQEAFLSGYRETGPASLDTEPDERLISLYRSYKSLNAGFKRWRQRRYTEMPRNLVRALHWRRATLA